MFKKIFLVILTSVMSFYSYPQTDPLVFDNDFMFMNDKQVVPPSPNAASLGKFGEMPVSLYTGLPTVNIPIWNLNLNDLSLDISVSYHASGVKVDELPGWVGVGWALNAGGSISRTMYGMPDELPIYGYFTKADIIPDPSIYFAEFKAWVPSRSESKLIADGSIDMQPDVFYFNFAGKSGKILIDPYSYNATVIPYENWKVIFDQELKGFTITTDEGIIYNFGDYFADDSQYIEITTVGQKCASETNPTVNYTSCWHLQNIINPKTNEQISFYYRNGNNIEMKSKTETEFFNITPNPSTPCGVGNFTCPEKGNYFCEDNATYSQRLLEKIIAGNYKIEFKFLEINTGIHSYALDTIKVSFTKVGSEEIVDDYYKIFTFSYNKHGERHFLNSISGISSQPYLFSYYSPQNLPPRYSKKVDYWGFYNGYNNNVTLVPEVDLYYKILPGANRCSNSGTMNYGSLSQIVYPTGGITDFIYEANRVSGSPLLNYNYENLNFTITRPESETNDITHEETLEIQFNQTLQYTCNINQVNGFEADATVNLIDENGNSQTLYRGYNELGLAQGIYHIYVLLETPGNTVSFDCKYKTIENVENQVVGGLRIKEIINDDGKGNKTYKSYEYLQKEDPLKSSGTLVTSNPIHNYQNTEIQYCTAGGVEYGSGLSSFFYQYSCDYLVRNGSSSVSLATTSGSHVGYSYVTEYIKDNSVLPVNHFIPEGTYTNYTYGKTCYSYIGPDEIKDIEFNVPPFAPSISMDWKRGMVKSIEYYDNSKILKKEEFDYYTINNDILNKKVIPGFVAAYYYPKQYFENLDYWTPFFNFQHYYFETGWKYNTKKIETIYNYNNDNIESELKSITEIDFDDIIKQKRKISFIQPDGNTIVREFKYPIDFENTTNPDFIEELVQRNIHTFPLTFDQYIISSGVKKGSQSHVVEYQGLFPKNYFSLNQKSSIAPYSELLVNNWVDNIQNYDLEASLSYNSNGSLKSKTTKNGKVTSYGYIYNGHFPVVSIVNAEPGEFYYNGFENDITNGIVGNAKAGKRYQSTNNYILTHNLSLGQKYEIEYWGKNSNDDNWAHVKSESILTSNSFIIDEIYDYIDEIRIYPVDAQITTYTYHPFNGVTSTTDPNGLTTYYNYDEFGRLISIVDQDQKILKEYSYHIQESGLKAPVITECTLLLNKVTINWNAVSDAESYTIYRSVNNGPLELIATGITTTTYIDNSISTNCINKYIVRSVKDEFISDLSQEKVIYTLLNTPVFTTSSSSVCAGSIATYTISQVTGATCYEWTVPTGSIITSGIGTSNVTIQFGASSGNVAVKAVNQNTFSEIKNYYVTINPLPVDKAVSDPTSCSGTLANIVLSTSEIGVSYQLRLNSNNSAIGSPVTGNGININLPASPTATTLYNVLATKGTCSLGMTDKPTINVKPLPAEKTVNDPTICSGEIGNIILSSSESGVSYQLVLNSNNNLYVGSSVTGTGGNINLPASPTSTTLYNVLATKGTCSKVMVDKPTIIVNPLPAEKTVSDPTICSGETGYIVLSSSELGVSYQLCVGIHNIPVGSPVSGNGGNINLPVSPTTTTLYNVLATKGTCSLLMTDKPTINVNPLPVAPTTVSATNMTICSGSSTILSYSGGSGDALKWYTSSNGGIAVGTGNNVTVSPTSTTTYYGRWETTNCGNSASQSVTITVNPLPVAPTTVNATNMTICSGSNTTLTYSGGSGTTFKWYTSSCGGTVAGTGNNVTVSPTVTTTYYGRWENGCGNSICKTITISVSNIPSQPSVINGNTKVCSATSVTYSVTPITGATTYQWTIPAGWTIVSGQGTRTINLTVGTLSGSVGVSAGNTCGYSSVKSIDVVTYTTKPILRTDISGPTLVDENNIASYTISGMNVTTFYWAVPAGCTIISGQGTGTISVKLGTQSGNISVYAENCKGTSLNKYLAVTVNDGSIPR